MIKQTHIRFDWAIKKMLRSKANFGILEGFLSVLLEEDIKIQDILESEGNQNSSDDKFNRVDIMVKDSKGELIIIEIQNTRELDYFYKILYNTSKAITDHMHKGMPYNQVRKVITVSVVYFDLGQGQDYVYHGATRFLGRHQNDELMLSEAQKKMFKRSTVEALFPDHYIIKVNDFNDIARDSLDEWIYFFKNSEIKDEFKAKGLAEAREKLKEINLTGADLAAYERYLEQLSYEASIAETIKFEEKFAREKAWEEGLVEGREKGIEEGRKEGRENASRIIARKMKENGADADFISATTGLEKEVIEEL